MVAKMAERPLILALANPEPEILPERREGGAPRRRHRHRALGLSEPGQQRAVLPVHLPRRARRRRDDDQRARWSSRRCARSPSSRRRSSPTSSRSAYGIEIAQLRPRVPDPASRSIRASSCRSRRRWPRRRWTRAWRRGRSRTSTPIASRCSQFVYQSGLIMKPMFTRGEGGAAARSSTPKARTSACCARCRSWSTKAWRSRSWSGGPR